MQTPLFFPCSLNGLEALFESPLSWHFYPPLHNWCRAERWVSSSILHDLSYSPVLPSSFAASFKRTALSLAVSEVMLCRASTPLLETVLPCILTLASFFSSIILSFKKPHISVPFQFLNLLFGLPSTALCTHKLAMVFYWSWRRESPVLWGSVCAMNQEQATNLLLHNTKAISSIGAYLLYTRRHTEGTHID